MKNILEVIHNFSNDWLQLPRDLLLKVDLMFCGMTWHNPQTQFAPNIICWTKESWKRPQKQEKAWEDRVKTSLARKTALESMELKSENLRLLHQMMTK